jgi:hypothetical protein
MWLWPHTLMLWKPGTEMPAAAVGFVIVFDRPLVLSPAAQLWCATIIDFGEGAMLCGRTEAAVESGSRLIEPLIGGAGNA